MSECAGSVVRSRDSVPVERTWAAESVFATPGEWDAELEAVVEALPGLAAYEGRLRESAAVLREALALRDDLLARVERLGTYAVVAYAVDTTDPAGVARFSRSQTIRARAAAASAFVEPELLAVGRETLDRWLAEDAQLAVYRHYLDDLFRRERHLRSPEVEEVLGGLGDAFSGPFTVYSGLVDTDLRFEPAVSDSGEEAEVSHGSVDALLARPDRSLRRAAWNSYADGYLRVRHALAANLVSSVKQAAFAARERRYGSTLEAALAGPNLPVAVVDNLIAAFQAHLPTWHRYWRARGRLLGLETLEPYDARAPLADEAAQVGYEQAVEWICASLAPLGEDYVATVRRGCLEERWVDVYPTRGKMAGAFSAGAPGTRPFIVMSFDGTVTKLGTLAHELGHSMHSHLAWQAQPLVYTRYSLFAAEVASNFHQAMLRAHLLDAVDDQRLQLGVLEEAFSNFTRYLLTMPTLARLEREAHALVEEGQGVTADLLCERTVRLFAEAFGADVSFDADRLGIRWAQFGHLYEPFYVFQYATGISAANALARGVLAGVDGAAERYLRFLRAGGSVYPLDGLRDAGVDLESPEPVEAAFAALAQLVDRLEALAGSP